ncbi:hypothetical protein [Thermophagus xiamenensis]|uniref:Uncharacterized protein n=1 Tax=Thermophagus xiamenensis TaxID=385682 RepID=A0A1I2E218_9BACT|nr:hypothetical protein [Thermophagus xiamenensis]SFE86726.1 hypothetical protein SAMN05444380_12110 [Thermophagus xiamenensis]
MTRKLLVTLFILLITTVIIPQKICDDTLSDKEIRHILGTLPRLVPKLKEVGITVSPAYYIWPRDASLHSTGQSILEQFGYDALLLDALETFCKAWFCLNYDTLNNDRLQFLQTTKEHINENPYISDEQKKINIRILNKSLGHNKEELKQVIGEKNLRIIRTYRSKISELWAKLD